jgi:hypothetical protein
LSFIPSFSFFPGFADHAEAGRRETFGAIEVLFALGENKFLFAVVTNYGEIRHVDRRGIEPLTSSMP